KYSVQWMNENKQAIEHLVEHIRANGPVKSSDFERKDGKGGGWWEWKEEKRSLEVLFTAGRLMIARRQSFQRLYDLSERVLPGWDDSMTPHLDEVHRRFMQKAVFSLGVAKASWMGDYFRNSRLTPRPDPETLVAEGALQRVKVDGWDVPGYIHPELRPWAEAAADGQLQPGVTTLLSPFDPVVWDRRRAQELFGFDYRLECYTPEAKRRYGYFTLPILRRGALVGRIDAKAHRARGVFEVKVLHLEDGVRLTSALATDIAGALRRCGAWHGTPEIAVTRCEPAAFQPLLQRALAE
ncbi:MAG: YcaQ family DNA glycosylase, partial [Burkholderiaceae bacterium]|nr:YcaQ family DNA glycosylase [Burkholderiaceae bacterium]